MSEKSKPDLQSAKTDKSSKKKLFTKKCKGCEKAKKECDEYKAGWQRALADYKNLQTEIEQKKADWVKMSEIQVLQEFIPIYENFKKAFAAKDRQYDAWVQGIEYIKKQFLDVLHSHGVKEVKTVGEKFDPKFHEAVSEEEVEGAKSEIVLKEIAGGYKLGERVLQAAQVVVGRNNKVSK